MINPKNEILLPSEGTELIDRYMSFEDWINNFRKREGEYSISQSKMIMVEVLSSLIGNKEIEIALFEITDLQTNKKVSINYKEADLFIEDIITPEMNPGTKEFLHKTIAIKMTLMKLPRIAKLMENIKINNF